MDYTIKHVMTEHELINVLTFAKKVLGDNLGSRSQKEEWLGHMKRNNELLLYATTVNEVVGIALAFIEDNGNMTIGAVGVDERLRMSGVAKEMMLMLEERAKTHGVHLIALGAVQTAEGYYCSNDHNHCFRLIVGFVDNDIDVYNAPFIIKRQIEIYQLKYKLYLYNN